MKSSVVKTEFLLKSLKVGDLIMYIGDSTVSFTKFGIYEVIRECKYDRFDKKYNIMIRDNQEGRHFITDKFFNEKFLILD